VVLQSGIAITMIPLDVTHGVLSLSHRLEAFRKIGNRSGQVVAEMIGFSERFDLEKYGSEGAPLHDPCVIAWLLQPGLFDGRKINVTIETMSELTRGMTVADYWRITDRPKNVLYLRTADDEGFYKLLTERLARLP
jgi:purine nucleosidase